MSTPYSKPSDMDDVFEKLIDIRLKVSDGLTLTPDEKALWKEWINRPQVNAFRSFKPEDLQRYLSVKKNKLSWEEAKMRMGITFEVPNNGKSTIHWYQDRRWQMAAIVILVLLPTIWLLNLPEKGNRELTDSTSTTSTGNGEIREMVLADGTQVWLNATTTLHVPATFSKTNREVELDGEAFFKVNKQQPELPFIVKAGKSQMIVLGTSFNVNAYKNENAVTTTLVDGKLKVLTDNSETILKPNQQAIVTSKGALNIMPVDPEDFMDWKKGTINFKNQRLFGIMRKIERKFGNPVSYDEGITDEPVSIQGNISKSEPIERVLQGLDGLNNLKFTLRNDTIIVSKYTH